MGGFEIHCPACGPFWDKKSATAKGCPRCGNKQAFSLYVREDISDRFQDEKARGWKERDDS